MPRSGLEPSSARKLTGIERVHLPPTLSSRLERGSRSRGGRLAPAYLMTSEAQPKRSSSWPSPEEFTFAQVASQRFTTVGFIGLS